MDGAGGAWTRIGLCAGLWSRRQPQRSNCSPALHLAAALGLATARVYRLAREFTHVDGAFRAEALGDWIACGPIHVTFLDGASPGPGKRQRADA
eukprot:scaffold77959_cov64-Phaeocystis_antarctica.AAC.10